jgi:O-antigen ligase
MNRSQTAWLIWLPLVGLVALLALRERLGLSIDPVPLIAAFLFALFALAGIARFPAAFIAPALFIPWWSAEGVTRYAGLSQLTLAALAAAMGIVLRLIRSGPGAPAAPGLHDSRTGVFAFFLFAAIACSSLAWTASPQYGGDETRTFAWLGALMFLAPFFLVRDGEDLRDFVVGMAVFALVVAAVSLRFSSSGAMGATDNPAHITKAQTIGLGLLLLLYYPFENRKLRKLVLWFCVPFLALGLVSAEARGPLVALLLVVGSGFFVSRLQSPLLSRRQMLTAAVVIVAAVFALSAFWFYGASEAKFQYKATELIALATGSPEAQGTAVERLDFYRASISAWLAHPFLGWGIGGWSVFYWHQDDHHYPHNLFLQILSEQGVVGLAALGFLLWCAFRSLLRSLPQMARDFAFLLPGFLYLLTAAMFSGDLNDNRFLWFWCGLIFSCCGAAMRRQPEESRQPAAGLDAALAQPSPAVPCRART